VPLLWSGLYCCEYKRTQAVVRRSVRKAKKEYWRRFCDSVGRTTPLERIWGMKRNYDYPMLIDGENIVTTSKDKAGVIAKMLARVHSSDNLSLEEKKERKEEKKQF